MILVIDRYQRDVVKDVWPHFCMISSKKYSSRLHKRSAQTMKTLLHADATDSTLSWML